VLDLRSIKFAFWLSVECHARKLVEGFGRVFVADQRHESVAGNNVISRSGERGNIRGIPSPLDFFITPPFA